MILKIMRLLVIVGLLTLFSACKGQGNNDNISAQRDSSGFGEVVLEVDSRTWGTFQDLDGNYWFGSWDNGLFFYDGKSIINYTTEDGLLNNSIRGIQGDQLGNVYIDTPLGVSKYNGTSFTSLELAPSSENEWKLEPNDLWFSSMGRADDVYRYDGEYLHELKLPRKNLEEAFESKVEGLGFREMNDRPYSVYGIDRDKEGNMWFGTIVAGVYRYDGETFLWFPEKELSRLPDGRVPGVRSMMQDKNGYFWLSNFISKYRVDTSATMLTYEKLVGVDTVLHFHDRLPYFLSSVADKAGNLWMATYGLGVWMYDGHKLVNIPIMNGEREVLLLSIFLDNQGVFWLGTDGYGVYTFNGEEYDRFLGSK